MKKILFIPIDNRPVTYTLTEKIVSIHKNLELRMPKREHVGGLTTYANTGKILNFIKEAKNPDIIILSLDTIAYGGLVASRRSPDTLDAIKKRLFDLKEILKEKKGAKILAATSIMRISNNNINEEEKEYWNLWGEKIFAYSKKLHRKHLSGDFSEIKTDIPKEILLDYLNTRRRNFEINKMYLEWLCEGLLDFLVYSKDDTGEFGLNVEEASYFEKKCQNLNAVVKTGADEIPLGLLTRGITENLPLKINVEYAHPESIGEISRYEDVSVQKCVEGQITLGVQNAEITSDSADITLYVNNFETKQGDLVFQDVINASNKPLPTFSTPYILSDINNANGADNIFAKNLLEKGLEPNFLSYAGWNTSANTIGSALCAGIVTYLAKKEGAFNEESFKNLLSIRLLDDWAYQANIRIKVQTAQNKSEALSNTLADFKPYEEKINKFTGGNFAAKYSLPWDRSFEIEIEDTKNGN